MSCFMLRIYSLSVCLSNAGPAVDEWSECSKTCGGGMQFKRISENTTINRTCNQQPCHKEHCLEGMYAWYI